LTGKAVTHDMEPDEILSNDDLLRILDSKFRDESDWWDHFYTDRNRDIPFFVNAPDENLVEYFNTKQISPGKVLELGCGPGRNAIYLSGLGFEVDAIDISEGAVRWARERALKAGVDVNFAAGSIFRHSFELNAYDLVYDAGCLHHIPPHRRSSYLDLVVNVLKPEGLLGLVCFTPEGGSGLSDLDVYKEWTLKGGLGFTDLKLQKFFNHDFKQIAFRRMKEMPVHSDLFGKSFCWTTLMQKK